MSGMMDAAFDGKVVDKEFDVSRIRLSWLANLIFLSLGRIT
jgi:hypothetical protein